MTVVWVTATVLQLLAQHGMGAAGATFTATELAVWVKGQLTQEQRVNATSTLGRLQLLKHDMRVEGAAGLVDRYTVTQAGAKAIAEAAAGYQRKSGPKGSRKPNPHKRDSLVMRLWSLVRMRGLVDSDSAARTLCDAADPADFTRMQASVAKYLRRWCDAGALDESSRRVGAAGTSNGCKRYVLKPEWQAAAEPPRWRQIAKGAAQ